MAAAGRSKLVLVVSYQSETTDRQIVAVVTGKIAIATCGVLLLANGYNLIFSIFYNFTKLSCLLALPR